MSKPIHHKLHIHHATNDATGSSFAGDDHLLPNATEGQKARLALLREANANDTERSSGATKSPHEINRKLYYIDQLNDRRLRGHTFACGPTSLTMALADHCAVNPHTGRPTVHHPPTEQDRIGIIKETGTWAAGKWIGGPERMAAFAKRFGLDAEAYSANNLAALTKCLEQGKGAIVDGHCLRSGHAHYVYVAGRDANGYIMGDPASPGTTHWTAAHLQAFMTGYGFTAVWNKDAAPAARFVADPGGRGDLTAPVVPHLARNNFNANSNTSGDDRQFRKANLPENHFVQNETGAGSSLPAVSLTSLHRTAPDQGDNHPVAQNWPVARAGFQSPLGLNSTTSGANTPPLPDASFDSNQPGDNLSYGDFLGQGSFNDDLDQFFSDEQGLISSAVAISSKPDQELSQSVDVTSGSNLLSKQNFKIGIFPSASSAENVHRCGNAFMV